MIKKLRIDDEPLNRSLTEGTYIEKRLMKYIPKRLQPYVVWLDYEPSSHVYFLTFEKDGVEYSPDPADDVSELTWNARQYADVLLGRKKESTQPEKKESVKFRKNIKESGMYDYYDVPDNAFDTHNDMPTQEDDWWASIPSELRAVVHEMEEQGWEGVGFTTTGVEYCISTEDKNRPELSYEMCVTIYDRDDSVSLSKYVDIFDWDKEKEVSRIPNTSGVAEFRTPQDVKKFAQWFRRLGTSFSTKESIRKNKNKQ